MVVLGGGSSSDTGQAIAGFGLLFALPPLISGPVGLIMAVIALIRPQTAETPDGRRHAIIGVATGMATLALCCVIGAMLGYIGGQER
jgi:serine/threonine protein kinase, bacterial